MTFLEQFKTDMLLIWRTKGWVVMTLFSVSPIIYLTDLPQARPTDASSLFSLGFLAVSGAFGPVLFGQSCFGAEYGFWNMRFMTKTSFKKLFLKRLGMIFAIYATFTGAFTIAALTLKSAVLKESLLLFYVGMLVFGVSWTLLYVMYSSSIQPIPFEQEWLRINSFSGQGFSWQNLIIALFSVGLIVGVGYAFVFLEPVIWFISVVLLAILGFIFAGWSINFLTKYLYQRRFIVMQKLLLSQK